ncbi:hypothetical protein ACNKHK_21960 [Shigella flexneri]
MEHILAATEQSLRDLMGNSNKLHNVKATDFTDRTLRGADRHRHHRKELEKPVAIRV